MKTFFRKKIGAISIVANDKQYIKRLEQSVLALRTWDYAEYRRVQKQLDTIFICHDIRNYNQTNVKERAWLVGRSLFAVKDYDIPYIASLIIHEAHHIAQFRAGKSYHGAKAEEMAYHYQRRFLKKIKYDYAIAWLDKRFSKRWWSAMDAQSSSKKKMESLWKRYINKQ